MRKIVVIAFGMLALALNAFDSANWLAKRDALEQEATRLRMEYTNCLVRVSEPATDVTIPVDTYEDGSVKMIITARKAQYFHSKGLIWAENLTVKKYDREGTVSAKIDARNCVIDRVSRSGWAQGAARLVHGETEFTGEGIYFSSPEGYVMVFDHSEIISKDLKFGGVTK